MGFAGYFLKAEIGFLASAITKQFGIWGLMILTFLGDSFPSPFPPDIALMVIAKGPLRSDWPTYLMLITVASFLAGHLAYFWGSILSHQTWLPSMITEWPEKHQDLVKKWGGRVVVIGALTPFPYSLACMSAGFVKLNYRTFMIATVWRIPRILTFYFAIHFL
jgi:membrane protein YqaA with SNARE-associated domain